MVWYTVSADREGQSAELGVIVHINAKTVVQTGLAVLLVADYVAAKVHFFSRYDPSRAETYARGHIVYWLIAAVLGLLIWSVEKSFPSKPSRPPEPQK